MAAKIVMKIFKIDPSIKLSAVPIFKIVLVALPVVAVICSVIIYANSDLNLDLSYVGFNTVLFTVLKFPFAILAAWVTILGVIAAIHRSAQTSLQIRKTIEQNVFANFYKHRKEYFDHMEQLKNGMPTHIGSKLNEKIIRGFYASTYPNNSVSNFTAKPSLEWIETFDRSLIELCYLLTGMKKEENHRTSILLYRESSKWGQSQLI